MSDAQSNEVAPVTAPKDGGPWLFQLDGYQVDMATIDSPSQMLQVMLYSLGHHAGLAKTAAQEFLKGGKDQQQQALLMLYTAGTMAAFIWPLPSRKKALAQKFPRRGADIQDLLGLSENQLETLKYLRDSAVHIDERIEEAFLESSTGGFTMWMVSETPPSGRHFMAYNPRTQTLSFRDRSIMITDLERLLNAIQRRSSDAFMFMFKFQDAPDVD